MFAGAHDQKAVVLDLGSAFTKCGYAGEGAPRFIIRRPATVFNSGARSEAPLEEHLRNIFIMKLQANPKERKVVICENAGMTKKLKETIAKILFDRLHVPSLLFVPCALSCFFASGNLSGFVVDVGHSDTAVIPAVEGVILTHAVRISPLGSTTLHQSLQKLAEKGELIRVLPPQSSARTADTELSIEDLDDILARGCFAAPKSMAVETVKDVTLLLPSGKRAILSATLRSRVLDCLFGDVKLDPDQEQELSIARLVLDSILACSIDARPIVVGNMILAGGFGHIPGIKDRIIAEMTELVETDASYTSLKGLISQRLKCPGCFFPPNTLAWTGGAIIGELPLLMNENSIRKDQWQTSKQIRDWTDIVPPHGAEDGSAATSMASSTSLLGPSPTRSARRASTLRKTSLTTSPTMKPSF